MPPFSLAAVLFDLDGSLVDTEPIHEAASKAAFEAHGLSVADDWFSRYRGRTDEALFRAVLRDRASRDVAVSASLDELLQAKARAYADRVSDVPLLPGVRDLLDALQEAGVALACVTSATRTDQEAVFAHTGLDTAFSVVVTADDVVHPKPDPQPYQMGIQRLDVTASLCVAVEDAPHGIRSARDAGCTPLGVTTSFDADTLKEAGARFVADTPGGLRDWLEV